MKKVLYVILCFTFAGCTAFLDTSAGLTNFKNVRLGMTHSEVASVMGNSVIIGYDIDPTTNTFKPITVANPHRRDVLKKADKRYDLEFYLTHVRQSDGKVSDDELTPFIYRDNKLIGTGWPYLNYLLRGK